MWEEYCIHFYNYNSSKFFHFLKVTFVALKNINYICNFYNTEFLQCYLILKILLKKTDVLVIARLQYNLLKL
jgi:hypothetical protein